MVKKMRFDGLRNEHDSVYITVQIFSGMFLNKGFSKTPVNFQQGPPSTPAAAADCSLPSPSHCFLLAQFYSGKGCTQREVHGVSSGTQGRQDAFAGADAMRGNCGPCDSSSFWRQWQPFGPWSNHLGCWGRKTKGSRTLTATLTGLSLGLLCWEEQTTQAAPCRNPGTGERTNSLGIIITYTLGLRQLPLDQNKIWTLSK